MIELFRLTIRDPMRAWAILRAMPLSLADRWALVTATAALAAILSWLGAQLIAGAADSEGMLAALSRAPLTMAGVQVASAALGAFLLSEVGRIFGGNGRFADALLAVGWLEAVMILLQAVQLVATVILPPIGALIGIATLMLAAYLIVAMTMAVHGFRNPLMVVLGIVGTVLVASFLMSILAATLGLLPAVPA